MRALLVLAPLIRAGRSFDTFQQCLETLSGIGGVCIDARRTEDRSRRTPVPPTPPYAAPVGPIRKEPAAGNVKVSPQRARSKHLSNIPRSVLKISSSNAESNLRRLSPNVVEKGRRIALLIAKVGLRNPSGVDQAAN
jgi:hypothetical protein